MFQNFFFCGLNNTLDVAILIGVVCHSVPVMNAWLWSGNLLYNVFVKSESPRRDGRWGGQDLVCSRVIETIAMRGLITCYLRMMRGQMAWCQLWGSLLMRATHGTSHDGPWFSFLIIVIWDMILYTVTTKYHGKVTSVKHINLNM